MAVSPVSKQCLPHSRYSEHNLLNAWMNEWGGWSRMAEWLTWDHRTSCVVPNCSGHWDCPVRVTSDPAFLVLGSPHPSFCMFQSLYLFPASEDSPWSTVPRFKSIWKFPHGEVFSQWLTGVWLWMYTSHSSRLETLMSFMFQSSLQDQAETRALPEIVTCLAFSSLFPTFRSVFLLWALC